MYIIYPTHLILLDLITLMMAMNSTNYETPHYIIFSLFYYFWSQDISVSIVTSCTAGVQFPTGAKDFSLIHSIQTGSWAHPAFCTVGTKDSFLRGKAASSAKVKNDGAIPPLPDKSSWHGA
jgi:hypothetical protein